MLWCELLIGLDEVRVLIRSNRPQKLKIEKDDAILAQLQRLIDDAKNPPVPVVANVTAVVAAQPLDDLLATLPFEAEEFLPKPEHKVKEVIERGEGEGRLVVMARETPRIKRAPVLEEVTEDKVEE